MRHEFPALFILVLGFLAGYFFVLKSGVAAATVVSAALVLALVVLFLPAIERRLEAGGRVSIGAKGLEIDSLPWKARVDEPLLTIIPTSATDSTRLDQARALCNRGREIISHAGGGETPDLDSAFACFREAAVLDPNYWEALINLAQVMLIRARLTEALATSADVRVRFASDPLAFCKATLIFAKVLELRIPRNATPDVIAKEYNTIAQLLREALVRLPEHMATRISLAHALLMARVEPQQVKAFLEEGLHFDQFRAKFRWLLQEEKMLADFQRDFPGILD